MHFYRQESIFDEKESVFMEVEVDVASEAEEEDEDDADEESVIDSLLLKGVFWTLTCCCSKMRLVVTAGPLFLLANDAYTWNVKEQWFFSIGRIDDGATNDNRTASREIEEEFGLDPACRLHNHWPPRVSLRRLLPHARGLRFESFRVGFPSRWEFVRFCPIDASIRGWQGLPSGYVLWNRITNYYSRLARTTFWGHMSGNWSFGSNESKRNGKEGMSSDLGRQNKAPRQVSSPPIRRKTSEQNIASPKLSCLPSNNNVPLQPSGDKIVDNMEAGSYFANQMLNLRARHAIEKKSESTFNQREGGNHGTIGREEESAYATPKKVSLPEKGTNENDSFAAMDRQRLHTRETNSGSLSLTARKPVTRSASGKKPQAQNSLPQKQSPLCQSKQAHLDGDASSFVETRSKRSNTDVSPGFKKSKRKEREELETRPVKTGVIEEVHKDKTQKANDGRKTKAVATDTSLNVNRKRDSEVIKQNTEGVLKDKTQKATDGRKTKAAIMNTSLFENRTRDREVVKPPTETKKKTHNYFDDLMTSCHPGGNNGTTSNNHVDLLPFANRSCTTNSATQYGLKSQTSEFKSSTRISSPVSSFEIDKDDLDADSSSENSFKTKQTRSSHSKGFSKEGHCNANTEVAEKDFNSLPEGITSHICSRLDLFEITRMRVMNKRLRNLTMTPEFARDHKRTGMTTNWLITQYHTEANPALGIIKAIRLLDERLVRFSLEGYDINVGDHQSLVLKCTLGSMLLFHVVPNGSLRVLNLSNGRVTTINTPNPPFNQASFGRIHEFKMLPDPEYEFSYLIIHEQVIQQGVVHFEYRSINQTWTNVDAQPVPNILHVNTHDPRTMIFESGQVRFVAFSAGHPVVLSQNAHQLTHEAFAEDGVFELNEQGDRVMGELVRLWSRGSNGWFVVVESNDNNAFDIRIEGIVLFRLRGNWSGVDFVSRMQAELLPVQGYDLTEPLLEEVNGVVHLTFATRRHGARGCLVFSFNPTSGWTSREQPNLTLVAIGASPVFVTRLNLMPVATLGSISSCCFSTRCSEREKVSFSPGPSAAERISKFTKEDSDLSSVEYVKFWDDWEVDRYGNANLDLYDVSKTLKNSRPLPDFEEYAVKMDDPNITMEEYIRLEEEKARRRGKVYNWETATFGKIWDNEDIHDLGSVEIEFPAIVFNDTFTSEAAFSCEPTVSSLNDEIDFRISFDESDDEDCT
ncbi:meiosis-specific protein ASY3, partial [Tanacetum coccineum]